MQVIATAVGFDGVNIRNPGDVFVMPDDVFKVNKENHAKREKAHNAKIAAGKESEEPRLPDLWFKEHKGSKDGSDLA